MRTSISAQLIFAFLIGAIYCVSWLIQNQLLLNWDVSYFLHGAKLILAGGSYLEDFFNPNPPLILLLSIPPLLFSAYFKLSVIVIFRAYVFGLATILLCLCWKLLTLIVEQSDFFMRSVILLAMAVSFLIMPFYEFGQRDHLFFMLTLPYSLLLAARLQRNSQLKLSLMVVVGLLSGLGFLIKPQFLIVLLLLETYYCLCQKSFLAWLRWEILIISTLLATYIVVVFLFFPDFIFRVLPFLLRNYYSSVGEPWLSVLFNPIIEACCFPLLFYVVRRSKNQRLSFLTNTLVVALVGYLLACFTQHNSFYYHLLPPLFLAIILSTLLFSITACSQWSRSEYWRLGILVLIFTGFLMKTAAIMWISLIYLPREYFSFFSLLFGFILVSSLTILKSTFFHWSKYLGTLVIVLGVAYGCFYMAHRTVWSNHQFFVTTLLLVVLFGLSAPRYLRGVGGNILLAFLGATLFVYPVYAGYSIYGRSVYFKNAVLLPLIDFVSAQPLPRRVYFFTSRVSYSGSLINYAHIQLAQRFDSMWPILGFNKQSHLRSPFFDEKLFKNMVLEDFKRNHPNMVIVDMRDPILKTGLEYFDYLAYFKQDPQFKREWSAYRFLTDVEHFPHFKIRVFVRK